MTDVAASENVNARDGKSGRQGEVRHEQLVRQLDALIKAGRTEDVLPLVAALPDDAVPRPVLLRKVVALLMLGRLAEAVPSRAALIDGVTETEAHRLVIELWRVARRCAAMGKGPEATFAADAAATLLGRFDLLPTVPDRQLLEGLQADAINGGGEFAIAILGHLLHRGIERSFFIKFLAGLGGSRPHLGGKRPLDVLAARARAVAEQPDAAPLLREGAALMLYAAQDFARAVTVAEGAPAGSLAALVAADAGKRVKVSDQMRRRAVAPAKKVARAAKDHPPFIVVHRGGQDYVALCAASLALQNGANNVVLLGDDTTATIGIGRYAAISDYFESAAAFAPSYVHHSVSEPIYGLFSFQRWLVVEEFCRKNRIDQCVVIDSDALAFSSASEIIAAMPPGYGMNDWTWTTTVRDRMALAGLADCMRSVYARPRDEIVPFVNSLGRMVTGREARSFQDMHMFYHYRDTTKGVVVSQYAQPFHGGLDQASTLDNGLEVGAPGELAPIVLGRALKRPYLQDGRLHFREEGGAQRFIRFHTVHCQGPAKAVLHHYAALMLPGAEDTLAAWASHPAPTLKASTMPVNAQAPQDASSQPANPTLKHVPNLRLPEHAALKERLRGFVNALAPLGLQVSLRLADGPVLTAGGQLRLELEIHNPGARGYPDAFEGYAALLAGFVITAETADGIRKVAEPRWAVPEGGFPAGATVTLAGTLPTAKLAPGRYKVSADLVFEYTRWFERNVDQRPTLTFEVVATASADSADPAVSTHHPRHEAPLDRGFNSSTETQGMSRVEVGRR
ncbi:hypothetical protein [Falsiroseomonas sp.]|uniref:hypothetical protein n=1 Tax=Falsiroseomonas sp. TaxID=2870721 RepID=UPI003F6FCE89